MVAIPSELMSQLSALPPQQRYDLAQELLNGIDESEITVRLEPEWEQELVAEIDRRMERYHRGETQAVEWNDPAEEAFRAEVRQRLGK